jgi:hypothetical protein
MCPDLDSRSVSLASVPGSMDLEHHGDPTTAHHSTTNLTGRPPVQLYLSCDPDSFSPYQVMVRKNIELFEACHEYVESSAQGRNKAIVLGQVGIRCIHCSTLPPKERSRGAFYFPSKLEGLYQAAQNLANGHLISEDDRRCPFVPAETLASMLYIKNEQKSSAGGGKSAWADRAHAIGVYEDEHGLRFAPTIDAFAKHHGHKDDIWI